MNAAAASNLSQAQTMNEIGYAIAKKSLNVYKEQGKSVISMLESAAKVSTNMNMDPSKGRKIDHYG